MTQRNSLLVVSCIAMIIAITEAWNAVPTRSNTNSFALRNSIDRNDVCETEGDSTEQLSRRGALRQGMASVMVGTISPFSLAGNPSTAAAASEQPQEKEGLMSASAVADLMHPIPTFTLVDEKGIPFTVVGEDAKVTGYFFTTYPEAARILQLAKKSADKAIAKAKADKEEDIGVNPWKNARVSTIPLDYAVTVVSKSMRMSGGGVYFKIAPAEGDVDDALAVTGDEDLAEGKCPLFYYPDFTIDDGEGKQKTPLYFRKDELEKEWRRTNPKTDPPQINVTELLSLLSELVRPGGTDDELRNLMFVSPRESMSKRQECLKKGGNEPAFVIGKRIIVL
mmetsp:Transcript_49034/g.101286  ORF Transcript_49034/g.101286 Transcript_49034/m.101286 type:complete len:337 (-) Transcript_49034:39-1049(-)|eukprot:CAMPEP_0201226950 /NCGR_PEP_ID=MMETSP0851-20130426/194881_1 /ASSEMBLY_ACC=CAM_ASM_000631 /TAXON_ID=183588 /ORGANISM="Pseudo-nitzschia fraudulenta, Strain WWA7" /LENGTH=336 /DNA_ID=CAMNT_0047516735 /DNA_START=108 /DNA_END=1118 /DNA_ORIENTATION=+